MSERIKIIHDKLVSELAKIDLFKLILSEHHKAMCKIHGDVLILQAYLRGEADIKYVYKRYPDLKKEILQNY